MKSIYTSPTLEATVLSSSDILLKSDVIINGSGLFAALDEEVEE